MHEALSCMWSKEPVRTLKITHNLSIDSHSSAAAVAAFHLIIAFLFCKSSVQKRAALIPIQVAREKENMSKEKKRKETNRKEKKRRKREDKKRKKEGKE